MFLCNKLTNKIIKFQRTIVVLGAYGGAKLYPVGRVLIKYEFRYNSIIHEFFIVQNYAKQLFGLETWELLGFIKRINTRGIDKNIKTIFFL